MTNNNLREQIAETIRDAARAISKGYYGRVGSVQAIGDKIAEIVTEPGPLDDTLDALLPQPTASSELVEALDSDIGFLLASARDDIGSEALAIIRDIRKRRDERRAALSATPVEGWRPDWIKTTERLPEKPGKKSYEYVDCLIVVRGEVLQRPWNCEHLVWDDIHCDDFEFHPTEPTHWMPLPPPPALQGEGE